MQPCLSGLDVLRLKPEPIFSHARLGLLSNPAGCALDYTSTPLVLEQLFPGQLKVILGPQHGFFADKQDNMVESDHGHHPQLHIPIYSLYGLTRRPTPDMLQGVDILLVDLLDVGCRVYTFFSTLLACLEVAADLGMAVCILDRPNPLGRGEEGPILPPELFSFVGPYAMPLRHGLSLGELARLVVREQKLDLSLTVIPVQGWCGQTWPHTGLPWIMPSPNLPAFDSAQVYPGQVLLEGTSLSEGRGTTRPFELFGAPGLRPELVLAELKKETSALPGVFLRPVYYEPTFHKYAGETCGGFQLHVVDAEAFRPLQTTLAILGAINRAQPGLWSLRQPPYEYEYERRPLDLLLGDTAAVDKLLAGALSQDLQYRWARGLKQWQERYQNDLLYPV